MKTALSDLPGSEIVVPGLEDARNGRESADSLAVQMAASRLRAAGFDVPERIDPVPATHRLYELLSADHGDAAHSRLNAISRRVSSFVAAAERAQGG